MGTKIIYNNKTLAFRCDKKRNCSKDFCEAGLCERTTDIEHAVFDGDKAFETRGGGRFLWEK